MSNLMTSLLARCDQHEEVILTADDVEEWNERDFDWCLRSGVLTSAQPTKVLSCRECPEQCVESVVYLEPNGVGPAKAFLPCPQCGPVSIPLARLRRWQLDFHKLWEGVLAAAPINWDLREIAPRRLWRIGKCPLADGRSWNVIVGRMLWRADGTELLRKAGLSRQSIVFVPFPWHRADREQIPNVVPLCDVISWSGTNCAFDWSHVEQIVGTAGADRPKTLRRPRKRAERAATIERLERLMKDHVAAARDHAHATAEAGAARLLPRPTQRDLARLAGTVEMTVSRCLRDPAARELRLLWDLAADLDGLLKLPPPRR